MHPLARPEVVLHDGKKANPVMGANSSNAKLYEMMGGRDADVASNGIRRSLQVLRTHLGMDVAYLSRFDADTWVLRDFDAAASDCGLAAGQTLPRNATYCGNVAAGRLPSVIPDTAASPLAAALRVTKMLTIGSHVGAPIVLEGGEVWGMLCCYAFHPEPSLNDRDLALVESFAEVVACEVAREREESAETQACIDRVTSVIDDRSGMIALLQPIWTLARGTRWGAEALVRIAGDSRGPEAWFRDAAAVSLREELELAAVRKAVESLAHLDAATVLSVNVSPKTVLSGTFRGLVADVAADRILLELTEHLPVDDYDTLRAALAPLRGAGMRVAVDDAGGGYASMTHILQLRPDVIKADMALTRDIDSDKAKQSLIAALAGFAQSTRATLLAKGIETAAELAQLKRLGVELGQGYLLGRPTRPQDIDDAFAAGAAAFRPALVRGREWVDAVDDEAAAMPDTRRRFASAIDSRVGRFVV